MAFCSLLYRRRLQCLRREAFIQGGPLEWLCSKSLWRLDITDAIYSPGAAPPGETQLLSPACELLLLWVHQTQQHPEPAGGSLRRFVVVCVVIYTEMKIPDQHSASSCGLISVIHNLLVLGEIKAVTSRRSPQTTHRILHLSVYKHPSSPLCWEVCGIYLQLSHLLHFRKLGTDSTLSSADLLPTACHFTLSGWWQTPWFIQHGGLERFYSGKRKLYWVPSLLKYPEEAAKGLTETACTMSQHHSNCSQHA